jgi:hypothetical protein
MFQLPMNIKSLVKPIAKCQSALDFLPHYVWANFTTKKSREQILWNIRQRKQDITIDALGKIYSSLLEKGIFDLFKSKEN